MLTLTQTSVHRNGCQLPDRNLRTLDNKYVVRIKKKRTNGTISHWEELNQLLNDKIRFCTSWLKFRLKIGKPAKAKWIRFINYLRNEICETNHKAMVHRGMHYLDLNVKCAFVHPFTTIFILYFCLSLEYAKNTRMRSIRIFVNTHSNTHWHVYCFMPFILLCLLLFLFVRLHEMLVGLDAIATTVWIYQQIDHSYSQFISAAQPPPAPSYRARVTSARIHNSYSVVVCIIHICAYRIYTNIKHIITLLLDRSFKLSSSLFSPYLSSFQFVRVIYW